jgi:hypothetical protein
LDGAETKSLQFRLVPDKMLNVDTVRVPFARRATTFGAPPALHIDKVDVICTAVSLRDTPDKGFGAANRVVPALGAPDTCAAVEQPLEYAAVYVNVLVDGVVHT